MPKPLGVPALPRWGHPYTYLAVFGVQSSTPRLQNVMELRTHHGVLTPKVCHTPGVRPSSGCAPQGLGMVLHPRGQAPCHPSAANPEGAALLCKEGPEFSWPVLAVPLCPSIAWLGCVCMCISAVTFGRSQPILNTVLFPTPHPLFLLFSQFPF